MNVLKQEISRVKKMDLIIILSSISCFILLITLIILTGLDKDNKMLDIMMSNGINYENKISRLISLSYQFGNLFLRAAIVILESILISRILIDEFANNTITQLFSLHVSRGRIIINKILAIGFISVIVHFILQIILIGSLMGIEKVNNLNTVFTFNLLVKTLIDCFLISIIALLPLVFGMIKYSKIATVLSGVFLAAILCSLNPGSLKDSFINNSFILLILTFIVFNIIMIFMRAKINKDLE